MLIVDNCVGSFGNQLANGVPILPFDGDKNDRELVHLGKIIRKLVARDNLVQDNSRLFGLSTIRFCKEPRNYLEELVARLGKDFPEFKSV
jgi:CTD small phosphatase-like protein 2